MRRSLLIVLIINLVSIITILRRKTKPIRKQNQAGSQVPRRMEPVFLFLACLLYNPSESISISHKEYSFYSPLLGENIGLGKTIASNFTSLMCLVVIETNEMYIDTALQLGKNLNMERFYLSNP